jgi:hypothetical protein
MLVYEKYGFRANSSTEKAAFHIDNNLMAMNSKLLVGGIFCDLQKAFDCVNHKISMDKLEFYGTEVNFKMLTESYLTGRYQRVVMGNRTDSNNLSKLEIIKCDIPQGLILGPLFFLLYIIDLPKIIH